MFSPDSYCLVLDKENNVWNLIYITTEGHHKRILLEESGDEKPAKQIEPLKAILNPILTLPEDKIPHQDRVTNDKKTNQTILKHLYAYRHEVQFKDNLKDLKDKRAEEKLPPSVIKIIEKSKENLKKYSGFVK